MKVFNLKFAALSCACLLGLVGSAEEAASYEKSYAIVASNKVMAMEGWRDVVEALKEKHQAEVIVYSSEKGAVSALSDLQKLFPKYVCFVMSPNEVHYSQVYKVHRMMRQWDDDPYSDAIYSFLTGPTPEVAMRIAKATEPSQANTALITSAIGTERYREARIISDGQRGEFGIKGANDIKAKTEVKIQDMTHFFVESWNALDPDIILTSAHASQRNLEMPFGAGNLVCHDGKLYGLPNMRLINYATGQAIRNASEKEAQLLLKEPQNPKVVFCVGNCLIGDIPDENCMALTFMGYGKTNQMIGYSTTTWYGKVGWTALKLWEQNAGNMPLNEAYYFSNQNLLKDLCAIYDKQHEFNPEYAHADVDRPFALAFNDLLRKSPSMDRFAAYQLRGMLWDRDAVIMYGDPAFECRLNQKNLPESFLPERTYSFAKEGNEYVFSIKAERDCKDANADTAPATFYFPQRLKNVKVVDACGMTPLITDNFILIQNLKAMKAGEVLKVRFTAEEIKR